MTSTSQSNTKIAREVLLASAAKVTTLWNTADAAQGSADAAAILVMVEARDLGFFSDIKVENWHKIGTAKQRTAFATTVLSELFGIEKPTNAERQRLVRIKMVVPALCKAGTREDIALSESGRKIMVPTEWALFKKCLKKVEATGKYGLSVSELAKGGRQYLDIKPVSRVPLTTAQKKKAAKADADHLPTMKLAALSVTLADRVRKQAKDKLTGPENKALQALMVQLLGMFATDKAGLNTQAVETIYKKVS